MTRWRIAPFTT